MVNELRKSIAAIVILGLSLGHVALADPIATLVTRIDPLTIQKSGRFGNSVAVHGNRIVVGSPFYDLSGQDDGGYAELIELSVGGDVGQQQQLMVPANAASGHDVAIWGTHAVLGANKFEGTGKGIVYDLADSASPSAVLPESGAQEDDRFGAAVAVTQTTLFLGAPLADPSGNQSGTIGTYMLSSSGDWVGAGSLAPDDAAAGDKFGTSLAADEQVMITGAVRGQDQAGGAFIFRETPTGWQQEAELVSPSGIDDDMFGDSVAINGNYAAVGARAGDGVDEQGESVNSAGLVHVYRHESDGWDLLQTLQSPDLGFSDEFGISVAFNDRFLAIGDSRDNRSGADNAGAVFLYELADDGTWSFTERLDVPLESGDDSAALAFFGLSLDMTDEWLVVGAPLTSQTGLTQAGAVYVFALVPEPGSGAVGILLLAAMMASRRRQLGAK